MSPIEWLNQRAPGFQHLSQPEKDATMHFALLWSLFEAKALNTNANASAILSLVHEWRAQGRVDPSNFSDKLAHFQSRYSSDGHQTHHFHSLHLRQQASSEKRRVGTCWLSTCTTRGPPHSQQTKPNN